VDTNVDGGFHVKPPAGATSLPVSSVSISKGYTVNKNLYSVTFTLVSSNGSVYGISFTEIV